MLSCPAVTLVEGLSEILQQLHVIVVVQIAISTCMRSSTQADGANYDLCMIICLTINDNMQGRTHDKICDPVHTWA